MLLGKSLADVHAKSRGRDERRVARCGQGRWWWDERREPSVGEVGEVQTLKNTIASVQQQQRQKEIPTASHTLFLFPYYSL